MTKSMRLNFLFIFLFTLVCLSVASSNNEECKDQRDRCSAVLFLCKQYRNFMVKNCRKTCKFCNINEEVKVIVKRRLGTDSNKGPSVGSKKKGTENNKGPSVGSKKKGTENDEENHRIRKKIRSMLRRYHGLI